MARELVIGGREAALCDADRTLAREAFGAEPGSLQVALQRLLPVRPAEPIVASVAAGHARMVLLPWLPQLTRPDRWRSLAASRFEQIFCESTDGWILRVAEDVPPRPRLAAAIPNALLQSLQSVAKLRAVRVRLLDELGLLLQRERGFSGCVAQVGPDSACLLMLWHGELRRIRMRRFDALQELAVAARSEWAAARGPDSDAAAPGIAVAMLGRNPLAAEHLSSAIGCSRLVQLG